MKIKEVLDFFEKKYPLYLQEEYDNSGLQCGDREQEITGALVCFDITEKVIDEAIAKGVNLVISHHPLISKVVVKKIEPVNPLGRIIFKAIEHKIVLYSMHTNIDNAVGGVNCRFAQKIGLQNITVLSPRKSLYQKLVFFVPADDAADVKNALFEAGCGAIGNYDNCSFSAEGKGTFKPLKNANPFIGQVNITETVDEERVEMIFPSALQRKVIETVYRHHPYEEPAFDILNLENDSRYIGLGRIGELPEPVEPDEFFAFLKKEFSLQSIKYSGKINRKIKRVAVCGGSGSSFITNALRAGTDIFITGDVKYHDFFIPDNQMIIADIGHRESEQFIKEVIYNDLKENFTIFASSVSEKEISEINFV